MDYCCEKMKAVIESAGPGWGFTGGQARAVLNDHIMLLNYCPFCGAEYPVEPGEDSSVAAEDELTATCSCGGEAQVNAGWSEGLVYYCPECDSLFVETNGDKTEEGDNIKTA